MRRQGTGADMSTVRSALPPLHASSHPRRWLGAIAALAVLGGWAHCWAAAAASRSPGAQLAWAAGAGTLAGLLVILGHDAAHGSLTPWRAFNAACARLLLLPAWQTASGWRQAHRRHHAHTNLKGMDDGYPPLSPDEWQQLPTWRRWHLRAASTLPGLFLNYLGVWWRHVLWPRQPDPGRTLGFRLDSLLVMAAIASQIGWAATQHGMVSVFALVVWPFVLSMWWVSAITLQQHRHPHIRWFDDAAQWSQFRSQVAGTVHLRWPGCWSFALFNIFEHTAHHADPRQPFTALRATQRALLAQWPADVLVVDDPAPWKLAHLRRVLRECQLYDYREHRWLRFIDAQPARARLREGRVGAPGPRS